MKFFVQQGWLCGIQFTIVNDGGLCACQVEPSAGVRVVAQSMVEGVMEVTLVVPEEAPPPVMETSKKNKTNKQKKKQKQKTTTTKNGEVTAFD